MTTIETECSGRHQQEQTYQLYNLHQKLTIQSKLWFAVESHLEGVCIKSCYDDGVNMTTGLLSSQLFRIQP